MADYTVAIDNDYKETGYLDPPRDVLVIQDGDEKREYMDFGEPEDNRFHRDYDWIKPELERAYEAGKESAAAEIAWLRGALDQIARYDESDTGYQGGGQEAEMKRIAWGHLGMYPGPVIAEAETSEVF